MLFNSIAFLVFFPIVFFVYWFILKNSTSNQNIFLLLASYIFYAWWDWRFLSIIILISLIDYFIGIKLSEAKDRKSKKALICASIIMNLGTLCFFKYFNFFIGNMILLLNSFGLKKDIVTLNIILPLGISFYTLRTLSYTIDIYRDRIKPTKDIISYLLFVAFFPQLIAGPIEKAKNLLPQFCKKREFIYPLASNGGKLIIFGFFKKMVIADNVSKVVNIVYNSPPDYVGFPMVVATIFFAIQIYCDFSGYTDIARGTAKLLGFELMDNFNRPYLSSSISEFWKRWHISLSTWLRDYLYIPLAFAISRKMNNQKYLFVNTDLIIYAYATMITFLICGLWHGANWTFIIWGGIHGVALIIGRIIKIAKRSFYKKSSKRFRNLKIFITFLVVSFGWIFFRANSLRDAMFVINNLFSDIADYTNILKLSLKFRGLGVQTSDIIISLLFICFLLVIEILEEKSILEKIFVKRPFLKWSYYYLLVIFIIFWGTDNSAKNFIYVRF